MFIPVFSLFSEVPRLLLPTSWLGWVGFLLWLGALGALLYEGRDLLRPSRAKERWLGVLLAALTLPFSLFLGVRVHGMMPLPLPGVALEATGALAMLFSMIPWVLAAGWLGPLSALGIALLGGILIALWGTHSVFTPLEWGTLALLFAFAVQQRYRTKAFQSLRHPVVSALLVLLIYPLQ
jgi:hypothetical protein